MLAAGPPLVATSTTDPAVGAAGMFVQQLPWLLFALFSGALVDRAGASPRSDVAAGLRWLWHTWDCACCLVRPRCSVA